MAYILQRVEQVFKEKKLIGNYDFTEDEYSLMVDSVGTLLDNFNKNSYKLIFATLVEIAKRWKQFDIIENDEENSGYWAYVSKVLFGSAIDQKLCQKYRKVISWLGTNSNIPVVTGGQHYYATVMMHSFAPKNSIYSFFDLCYNVFKKDLDFGFTSDDEWLCEIVAEQMKNVLGGGYREDKEVSIGSSAYTIKIGLRSFVLNEGLSTKFIEFIKDTFYQINKLFNREIINENTRLERYIVEWWKNKTESEKIFDDATRRKRVSTVSKQNIVVKYIRNDNEVFLCIPSIRLDDDTNTIQLLIYVGGEQVFSEEMRTKRGELVVATKQIELELNDLLKGYDSINVRIKISENGVVIFDSEKNKTTSLSREFILFDGDREVFSRINKSSNYFVYSKDMDELKSIPKELTTYSKNLYNIYPIAGESLKGKVKQVFFVDKEKVVKLGKYPCFIGNLMDVEWLLDDISCVVYVENVKLMVPDNFNLKALELRIDMKSFKLCNLECEQLENNYYQYGLKTLGLIAEKEPVEISLFSYEREKTLLIENIIILPDLDIKFNELFYYGDMERTVDIITSNEKKELSWTNQDNEIKCPLNDGVLMIKIPYFRWRIDGSEWHNEPINIKLWYKEFLVNGDLIEIDNLREDGEIQIFGKAEGKSFEITKDQNGKFELGRAIYANEGKKDISVYCSNEKIKFELFNIATQEHFIDNPIIYRNGKIFWDVENTFLGENNDFFLIVKGERYSIRTKIGEENKELDKIGEDLYKIRVKIKDKNIFSREESYYLIYEGELIVGKPEKFRFKNKKIVLKRAYCPQHSCSNNKWFSFIPKYFIEELQFVQENDNIYYSGRLCVIDKNGKTIFLNTMENEKNSSVEINPVRIELRDDSTLWLVADWQGGYNFLGTLFYDIRRRGLCNIAKEDNLYSEINLYKFEKVEDV